MTRLRTASTLRRIPALCLLGLLASPAAQVAAQTPVTALGLGYPVAPIDGRAAAMGGTGLGLLGSSFSLLNPADMRQHPSPGFALSFAAEGADLEGGMNPVDTGRNRFNLVRAVAPFGDWALGIAFGSVFDQDWTARFQDTLILADGTVPFEETREHDGGISTIDVSAARSLGPLAVGVTAQRFTGSLRQSFSRAFDVPTGDAPSLGAAGGSQILSYSGWRFRGGATVEVGDRLLLSGAASLASTLTATPAADEESAGEVDIPMTLQVGASARPLPQVIVAGSFGWGEWSTADDVNDARSHDVRWFGAGVEYDGLRLLGGDFPIRIGGRQAELPFSSADEPIDERAVTGGFGWVFRDGTAEVNVAVEAGIRGDLDVDGLEESFRRLTVSFALRQFSPF